jgi:hypothetical protein
MLYSTLAPGNSLTADSLASSPGSLLMAAIWWPAALLMTIGYFVFISRRYRGKVSLQRDNQDFY